MVWATTEGDKILGVFWLVSFLYDQQSKTNRKNKRCVSKSSGELDRYHSTKSALLWHLLPLKHSAHCTCLCSYLYLLVPPWGKLQASLKSQLVTQWECVKFGESWRADSAKGFKRGCIYRCMLTRLWESLIITHSAHTSVKILMLFMNFQRYGNQDSMYHFNCVFIFQGSGE